MSNKVEATFHPEPVQTEQEFLGNAGGQIAKHHLPVEAWELEADADADGWIRERIADGMRDLVSISGTNSREHGFHDSWPDVQQVRKAEYARLLSLNITEKIALIHEEVSEALGEIRSGHEAREIYFLDKATGATYPDQMHDEGKPLLKPEGFLVELADAMIRIADLVYLVDGREAFVEALRIKHEYNATRPYKHGRKF